MKVKASEKTSDGQWQTLLTEHKGCRTPLLESRSLLEPVPCPLSLQFSPLAQRFYLFKHTTASVLGSSRSHGISGSSLCFLFQE